MRLQPSNSSRTALCTAGALRSSHALSRVPATTAEHEQSAAFDGGAAGQAPTRASGPRRWLQDNEDEGAPKAAPVPSRGGTLFERMSSMARGSAKAGVADDEDDGEGGRDPLDIPRFLNRQSNQ